MKCGLYAFRDIKLGTFSAPFMQANDAVAIRTAKNVCNDPSSELSTIASDIEFWKIAQWDDKNGKIESAEPKILINTGELGNEVF